MPSAIEILIISGIFFLPVSKAMAEACFVIALAGWVLNAYVTKTPLLPRSKVVVFYAVFLGLLMLSLLQIQGPLLPAGLSGIRKWMKYLAIFFMCWSIYDTPDKRRNLAMVFLVSMVIVSLDGFYQLYTGQDLFRGKVLAPGRIVRMTASFNAPNPLAGFLLFALPLCALFFCRSRARIRGLYGGAFLILVSAFLLTYSRGAFYALIFSLMINLILAKRFRMVLAAAAGIGLLVMAVPSLRYNFVQTIARNDITITERGGYWDVALNMIKAHPVTGVGLNTYHSRFPEFVTDPGTRQAYAHNCYLQMAAEIGVPGMLAFVTALLFMFWRSLDPPPESDLGFILALRIALAAFLIQSAFDTNLYALQTASLFWIFSGVFGSLVFMDSGRCRLHCHGKAS